MSLERVLSGIDRFNAVEPDDDLTAHADALAEILAPGINAAVTDSASFLLVLPVTLTAERAGVEALLAITASEFVVAWATQGWRKTKTHTRAGRLDALMDASITKQNHDWVLTLDDGEPLSLVLPSDLALLHHDILWSLGC